MLFAGMCQSGDANPAAHADEDLAACRKGDTRQQCGRRIRPRHVVAGTNQAPEGGESETEMNGWFTPSQIAKSRRISVSKVYAWIRSGELEAVDHARTKGFRPRWRISPEALSRFDQCRSNRVSVRIRPPRRPRRDPEVREWF